MCEYIGKGINICMFLVHCEWDDFSEWTDCSKSCGGGEKSRTRTLKTIQQNGGDSCLGDAAETQSCNIDSCPCMNNTVIHR